MFKESDGLYDWAEQLFKHEGYCIWDADKEDKEDQKDGDDNSDYTFMQKTLENWMGGECKEMKLTDSSGNTLYLDTKPLPGGNLTYGLYLDNRCSQESSISFYQYIVDYYSTYYYSEEQGIEAAEQFGSVLARWNELMSAYKVCQPCRAYSSLLSSENEENDEDGNDGEGAPEKWGYNCYDDAGYRNCNQVCQGETITNIVLILEHVLSQFVTISVTSLKPKQTW